MIYLDAGATTLQKPPAVALAVQSAMRRMATPGRGGHPPAMRAADAVYDCAMKAYAAREEAFGLQPDGTPLMRELERVVMLRVVDEYWMDHLEAMDDLRQGIGLRAYGNVKPVDEYKRAGFDMFDEMVNGIQTETVRRLFTVRVRREQKLERKTVARGAVANAGGDDSEKKRPVRRTKKPGRNDPCPCGKLRPNGLPMKYKDCCGKNA